MFLNYYITTVTYFYGYFSYSKHVIFVLLSNATSLSVRVAYNANKGNPSKYKRIFKLREPMFSQ